jgi:hypothetical protein
MGYFDSLDISAHVARGGRKQFRRTSMAMQLRLVGICLVFMLAAQASANTTIGDYEPLVRYDLMDGNLYITADMGYINSFIVKVLNSNAYNAVDVSMAPNNLPTAYGGFAKWAAGKAIGTDLEYTDPLFLIEGVQVSNLSSSFGEARIASLPIGLGAADFGNVSVTFGDKGLGIRTTDVTVVPEPSTLALLAFALGSAFVAAVVRRRRAA